VQRQGNAATDDSALEELAIAFAKREDTTRARAVIAKIEDLTSRAIALAETYVSSHRPKNAAKKTPRKKR